MVCISISGDGVWFYGRIINYDESTGMHRVHYSADNESEWMNIAEEIVLVATELVLVRLSPTAIPWPALKYYVNPKAREVLSTSKVK